MKGKYATGTRLASIPTRSSMPPSAGKRASPFHKTCTCEKEGSGIGVRMVVRDALLSLPSIPSPHSFTQAILTRPLIPRHLPSPQKKKVESSQVPHNKF